MTREELRRQLLAGCDSVLAHPWVSGSDNVTIAKAVREQTTRDDEWVDRLVTTMNAQRRATMSKTKAIDWQSLLKKLQDIAANVPQIVTTVELLISLLGGSNPPVQGKAVHECCDLSECLQCALECQLRATAALLKAQCCCPDPCPPAA